MTIAQHDSYPITFTHFNVEEENILTNWDNRFIRKRSNYERYICTVHFSLHGRPNGKQTMIIRSPLDISRCFLPSKELRNASESGTEASATVSRITAGYAKSPSLYFTPLYYYYYYYYYYYLLQNWHFSDQLFQLESPYVARTEKLHHYLLGQVFFGFQSSIFGKRITIS